MFTVRYTLRRGTRTVRFTMGCEASMFARQMARTMGLSGTQMSVRAPWGQFVPWR